MSRRRRERRVTGTQISSKFAWMIVLSQDCAWDGCALRCGALTIRIQCRPSTTRRLAFGLVQEALMEKGAGRKSAMDALSATFKLRAPFTPNTATPKSKDHRLISRLRTKEVFGGA